ncbi:GAF domain-containing protein [Streptomyces sp. NPDC016845]|uniref:GAF domain-containing protein n=1 Tax=Streptomyces sp. NPDC016845 TaxID=3364972 RepID=UPI00378B6F48
MSVNDGLAAVLASLRPGRDIAGLLGADPRLCAEVLGVDGVAVSVVTREGPSELVWCSGEVSARLEDLQFTLGQGPGPETTLSCAPVLEPDVRRLPDDRWPGLSAEMAALGIGAVFCLPLHVGAACLGTMTLQRGAPGPLADDRATGAWLVAGALTAALLAGGPAQEAFAAAEDGSDFYRAAVHQATGMISVQAGVPLAQALVLLRAYAFGHGRTVVEVAEDVVARRLRFEDDEAGPGTAAGEGTDGP